MSAPLGHSPYGAPEPRIAAAGDAWRIHTRDAPMELVGDCADGTPSYLLDELIEGPIVDACERAGHGS